MGMDPKISSRLAYWSFSIGVLLPLIVAFFVWRHLQPSEMVTSKLLWSFLWSYPLMIGGCCLGEAVATKIGWEFYASIGDNPGQMCNLVTGWMLAHIYPFLLAALFFFLKKLS
jgi:hypothetical protein